MESDEESSNRYYAILCMDGDDMGQFVGGARTPLWKDILSGREDDPKTPLGYFKHQWGADWDKIKAPLTPSFHAALSECLGNFSLYCARQIVSAFGSADGKAGNRLIYAGGDDVLAMLPATQAVDCAIALQLVFRGLDPARNCAPRVVQDRISPLFDFPADGFVLCKRGTGRIEHQRPNWPLMVMGPAATASVGIAIGHVHSPLQDLIEAAREAEHAAKSVSGKGALCLRVLKRSGEHVQTAARFDSGVWGIWDELDAYRAKQSGRFIYRFLQRLKPLLLTVRDGRQTWERDWHPGDRDLREIVEAELAHALHRHTEHGDKQARDKAKCWTNALMHGPDSLEPANFLHFWMARAFLNRLDDSGSEPS
jgi:CRISPR/Cas system-associated protein Cas10 (large subunit of type III CRISPR-Cas system)